MTLAQRLLMSGHGSAGLPLDSWTTNLWGAYSIQKLLTVYAAGSLQAVKSGDTTGTPIGFVSGALDTASLATYAGAGSAFVKTWFDQSGASNDMAQVTTANQPRIVNSGVYDGKLVFDGSNDGFASVNSSGVHPGITIFVKGNLRSTTALQILMEMTTNFGASSPTFGVYYDNSIAKMSASYNSAAGTTNNNYANGLLSSAVVAFRFDPSLFLSSEVAQFVAGSISSPSNTTNSGGPGSLGSFTYYFGARNLGASLAMALDVETLVVYSSALSDADIASISAAIA